MKLIGTVEANYYGCYASLGGSLTARLAGARPPTGWLITVEPPPEITSAAELSRWLGGAGYQAAELAPRYWRSTQLIDFLDVSGDQHLGSVRQRFVSDGFADFAIQGSVVLRRWLGAALELDGAARVAAAARLANSVRRYAVILGIDAARVLEEIRRQPDVEQLMALDNAVAQWSAVTVPPPDRTELVQATAVFADMASPIQSVPWHRWLWQLARGTTRAELTAIVDAAIADVDRRAAEQKVRRRNVAERRDEARRFADRMPAAIVHQLPVQTPKLDLSAAPMREEDVFHYVAFMAITEAVQALIAMDDVFPIGVAHADAMRGMTRLALGVLGLDVS